MAADSTDPGSLVATAAKIVARGSPSLRMVSGFALAGLDVASSANESIVDDFAAAAPPTAATTTISGLATGDDQPSRPLPADAHRDDVASRPPNNNEAPPATDALVQKSMERWDEVSWEQTTQHLGADANESLNWLLENFGAPVDSSESKASFGFGTMTFDNNHEVSSLDGGWFATEF